MSREGWSRCQVLIDGQVFSEVNDAGTLIDNSRFVEVVGVRNGILLVVKQLTEEASDVDSNRNRKGVD